MNLSEFLTQILAIENDPGKARFTDAQNTAALRAALARYNGVRPYRTSSLFDGSDSTLITLTGLTALNITKVWWVQADPQNNIALDFYAYKKSGTWYLDTKDTAVPTGTDNILVETEIAHTIDDLDAAASTTVPVPDQYMLAVAAAGFACQAMAVGSIENNNLNPDESQRYSEMGTLLLEIFERSLGNINSGIQSANWNDQAAVDKAY